MSDSNGSPHLEAEPSTVKALTVTTADDEARPYQHVTLVAVARGGKGYYLLLGNEVPASPWSEGEAESIVKLAAKLYLTPTMLRRLTSELQDFLEDNNGSEEGE